MKFLKKAFNFYILTNIHVALAVSCLVYVTQIEFEIKDEITLLFVFFSTIAAYNFIRFFRVSDLPRWIRKELIALQKPLIGITVFCSILVLILTFKIQMKAILWLFPFALFTLFYALPVPFKKGPLRNLPGVKIFLISISFAGITVLFPLVQNDIRIESDVWITFIQRFFFVVLITIPFDIRDLKYDREALRTLPQKFGLFKTKLLGLFFGCIFFWIRVFKARC